MYQSSPALPFSAWWQRNNDGRGDNCCRWREIIMHCCTCTAFFVTLDVYNTTNDKVNMSLQGGSPKGLSVYNDWLPSNHS